MADSIPPGVTMETGPVICGRCNTPLVPLAMEELGGFLQLRAGVILIVSIEANCAKCGWKFFWKIREQDIQKMIATYERLLEKIALYQPE